MYVLVSARFPHVWHTVWINKSVSKAEGAFISSPWGYLTCSNLTEIIGGVLCFNKKPKYPEASD